MTALVTSGHWSNCAARVGLGSRPRADARFPAKSVRALLTAKAYSPSNTNTVPNPLSSLISRQFIGNYLSSHAWLYAKGLLQRDLIAKLRPCRRFRTFSRAQVMTDEEKRAMDQFGITCEKKMIFHFQGDRYERLDDALNYAKKASRWTKPLRSEPKE